MQFVLDHLSAIMISAAVTLLILSTTFSAQRSAAEQTIAYAAKKQTLEMADTIEKEFLLIGDGTEDTIETISTNADGNTTEFSFWREDDLGLPMEVSYTLTELDSVYIQSEWRQLYRLNRLENDVPSGGGSSRLTDFQITLLNSSGSVTADVDEARLVRVRAVNAYPYGNAEDMYLFQSFWGISVRPRNLE